MGGKLGNWTNSLHSRITHPGSCLWAENSEIGRIRFTHASPIQGRVCGRKTRKLDEFASLTHHSSRVVFVGGKLENWTNSLHSRITHPGSCLWAENSEIGRIRFTHASPIQGRVCGRKTRKLDEFASLTHHSSRVVFVGGKLENWTNSLHSRITHPGSCLWAEN